MKKAWLIVLFAWLMTNYHIYKGGTFKIRAVVKLVKKADDSPLTIYSEPCL